MAIFQKNFAERTEKASGNNYIARLYNKIKQM